MQRGAVSQVRSMTKNRWVLPRHHGRLPCFYLFHRNTDHNRPHNIIDLEVPFGAGRVGIGAADARLGYSKIRIDGLEVSGPSLLYKAGIGLFRMSEDSP